MKNDPQIVLAGYSDTYTLPVTASGDSLPDFIGFEVNGHLVGSFDVNTIEKFADLHGAKFQFIEDGWYSTP